MKNRIVYMVVGLGLALSGCAKDEGKDSSKTVEDSKEAPETKVEAADTKVEAPETKPTEAAPEPAPVKTVALKIEAFGVELDVPEGWEGKQLNDNAYTMKIASVKAGTVIMMPTFTLMKQPLAPDKSLEKFATCNSGKLIDSKDVGAGKLFYVCELAVAGQAMFSLEWVIPLKEGSLRCSASGPDITAMQAACKSIRES